MAQARLLGWRGDTKGVDVSSHKECKVPPVLGMLCFQTHFVQFSSVPYICILDRTNITYFSRQQNIFSVTAKRCATKK